ncbi:glycosyltransferase [Horticoccus sp. 23ND18S-11]|uniref:glycosyltransferase n=1 Tax=Horticoccus sp. 23ND18S-11 TaxID=3391832 RepID=UPI0039C8D1A6
MNVVILNDAACIRGGADRIAFDSARALAAAGHRVTLFTGFGPIDPALVGVSGLTVECLGTGWIRQQQQSPRAALVGLWNFSAAKRLRLVLAGMDRRNTIVHAHLYSSALSASVLDAALGLGFVTVLSLHDYFITCPNGAYFVFPRAEPCERRALSASCLACNCDSRRPAHKAWRVLRTWIQNRIARLPRRLSAYAAVSQTCATLARRDLPPGARITVVPNVVAVDRQEPVAVARQRNLVFTGRLESYKGPQLLAAAAARLNLPVVFCGTGPLEPELRRLCPTARFTGWLSPDGVLAELAEARAFVFPSVYRETFGLSAAEALARGLPVVASRGTAAEEFVHHDRNGFLFAHNSADDLAAQLQKLGDDATASRLGARAYSDYWDAPLTLEHHLSHLLPWYRSVLPTVDEGPPSVPAESLSVAP